MVGDVINQKRTVEEGLAWALNKKSAKKVAETADKLSKKEADGLLFQLDYVQEKQGEQWFRCSKRARVP